MPRTLHHHAPTVHSLPWSEPLPLARGLKDEYWALLYSGAQAGYSGRYSYLAWNLKERIEADDVSPLEKMLAAGDERFDPAWFGYLGYGLKDSLETLTPETPGWLSLPRLCMMRFHAICEFDHEKKTLSLWSDLPDIALPEPAALISPTATVADLRSPMTRQEYLDKVAAIIDRIHAGDLYQANFTRKFIGEFSETPDAFGLFMRLSQVSPAPYSAFFKLGDTAILSSSPERFLSIDTEGHVTARPIKGTAARHADPARDAEARRELEESAKDKAENLMIVDLMRNDLARACVPGSVEVKRLYEVTTHATIHHMSSTIAGIKRPECTALDVVKQCFPPGSMTGAPKIRAMNLCTELERQARGVYGGAVGWFSGDGGCDLSVVIRTLIVKEKSFEFQVGGGIVADSTPASELAESLAKARGILQALGVPESAAERL